MFNYDNQTSIAQKNFLIFLWTICIYGYIISLELFDNSMYKLCLYS